MRSHPRLASWLTVVLTGLLALFAVGAVHTAARQRADSPGPGALAAPVPAFKHIFVIVMENKAYENIIGNRRLPYLNSLAQQYGLATNYYAIRHPSLPNYLALTGGDTFGITSDCINCTVAQPNLVDQLEAAGRSWKAYMESMPGPCFVGDSGRLYRQKHNPFIYYDNIRENPARCNQIVPFTQFEADLRANTLPNFIWITPNMCNDIHDCSPPSGDTWLKTWIPKILGSPAWQDGGVLFITFDEGSSNNRRGCCRYATGDRIATLVISPLGKPAYQSPVAYDHYSLLRTIETAWGLPLLGRANDPSTAPMADFFTTPATSSPRDHSRRSSCWSPPSRGISSSTSWALPLGDSRGRLRDAARHVPTPGSIPGSEDRLRCVREE
ncbi:MAG: alkaline phosphatase family protein [Ardenticatenaceae bacterium]|nr:alkaline phosphatase family protein [Ardenticatenaceae bacterium]